MGGSNTIDKKSEVQTGEVKMTDLDKLLDGLRTCSAYEFVNRVAKIRRIARIQAQAIAVARADGQELECKLYDKGELLLEQDCKGITCTLDDAQDKVNEIIEGKCRSDCK